MLNSSKFMKYVKNSRIGDNSMKIDRMIEKGVYLNYLDSQMKHTPLIASIILADKTSHICTVEKLINSGANVNMENEKKDTALIFACYLHNIDIIKMLIKAGANVNHQNKDGYTPLMVVQNCLRHDEFTSDNINNVIDIMNLLIDSGANITLNNKKKHNSIIMAIQNSNSSGYGLKQIKLLIEKCYMNLNLNLQFKSKKNMLSYACYYLGISSSYETIQYLLNLGVNPNNQDSKGYTPLMYLVSKSNRMTTELIDAIKLMLSYKPNLDLKCHNSHTALSIACINAIKTKDTTIIKLLIKAGADVNTLSNFNANCLSFLIYKGSYLAILLFDLFMEHNINLNVQSKNTIDGEYDGYTSLHYAARGLVEKTAAEGIIDILLKNGANPYILNDKDEMWNDIIDKEKKQKQKEKYVSLSCMVCLETNKKQMYMFNCGHSVSCESCSSMIINTSNKCPYCRETIKDFQIVNFID